ncbi:hypothetical protein Pmani_020585 [Petrolisthes manimaculis]|uniref:Uncharacterized protein n=1 Tax=Petrolisthes manimaculis TaxID=1843537 RepID=A0AAE1PI24_9EUCA|nr:hypothetical protein Pmani_020585 [Petrolisthes manimaculis]
MSIYVCCWNDSDFRLGHLGNALECLGRLCKRHNSSFSWCIHKVVPLEVTKEIWMEDNPRSSPPHHVCSSFPTTTTIFFQFVFP